MNNRFRTFIFQNYWWMIPLGMLVAVPSVIFASRPENVPGNVIALGVGALSVVYFIQKQMIEEVQLFERLFTRFNEQYARISNDLRRVADGVEADQNRISTILNDYFNLCAEEYLFYNQGRILPSVWRAWCRGICAYLENETFEQFWEREVRTESHYGLTTRIIREGAGLAP